MIILLHSSKTMRHVPNAGAPLRAPLLLEKTQILAAYLKTLSPAQLAKAMSISASLAEKTYELIADWTADPGSQSLALDSFLGDIYSGLHANDLAPEDRDYADETLWILSGLYGIIRPYDGICPYRLEMGYRLPDPGFSNLYSFWGDSIANCLPAKAPIVNLAAVEYAQTVTRFIPPGTRSIVSPRFLTLDPKTGKPGFVVVHAKIARGAFARWLITNRVQDLASLPQFDDLGYHFDNDLSTADSPAFVCEEFGGKGLSIRLQA